MSSDEDEEQDVAMLGVRAGLTVTALVLALAGCGGGSDDSDVSATPTGSASAAPTAETTAAAFTGEQVCTYLEGELPALRKVGSEVGAMAQVTMGLAGFFEEHGGLENADRNALEDLSAQQCPEVHDEVLKLAGITSFLQL